MQKHSFSHKPTQHILETTYNHNKLFDPHQIEESLSQKPLLFENISQNPSPPYTLTRNEPQCSTQAFQTQRTTWRKKSRNRQPIEFEDSASRPASTKTKTSTLAMTMVSKRDRSHL